MNLDVLDHLMWQDRWKHDRILSKIKSIFEPITSRLTYNVLKDGQGYYVAVMVYRGTSISSITRAVAEREEPKLFTTSLDRAFAYALEKSMCDNPCIIFANLKVRLEGNKKQRESAVERLKLSFSDSNQYLDFEVDLLRVNQELTKVVTL